MDDEESRAAAKILDDLEMYPSTLPAVKAAGRATDPRPTTHQRASMSKQGRAATGLSLGQNIQARELLIAWPSGPSSIGGRSMDPNAGCFCKAIESKTSRTATWGKMQRAGLVVWVEEDGQQRVKLTDQGERCRGFYTGK